MKKILIGAGVLIAVVILFFATPTIIKHQCIDLSDAVCDYCGQDSEACDKVGDLDENETCTLMLDRFEKAQEAISPEDGAAEDALCESFAK